MSYGESLSTSERAELDDPAETKSTSPDDPNEYGYVINKFVRAPMQSRWTHQAVTDYLPADEAIEWIEAGGPRA
jgi:hypothetical protein